MIKKPTVFILGAGASEPYNYPSGQGLVDILKFELSDENKHRSLFQLCLGLGEFKEAEIIDFAKQLKLSDDDNIDAFLERNQDFVKLGKVAITLILIEREDTNALFSEAKDKWYRDLVNKLKSNSPSNFKNNVAFLTFNYDRSFEHYLFVSIKHSYPISDKECAEMVKTIPIIHLHGHIGKLPWQTNDNEKGRPYNWNLSALDTIRKCSDPQTDYKMYAIDCSKAKHDIFRISEQIKIIYEAGLDDDTDFKNAHRLLSKAYRIYFLGFGYNDDNLRRLKIGDLSDIEVKTPTSLSVTSRIIDGSSYGIGEAKRKHINSVTIGRINLSNKNYKVLEFLKERVDFE